MVVVLGASGFIGSAVVQLLGELPVRLRAVSRSGLPGLSPCVAEVQELSADLVDPAQLAAAVVDADVIVHLVAHAAAGSTWRSASSDVTAEHVNVGVMRELVAALRARRRSTPPVVCYASTAQAACAAAASRYAQQKLAAEQLLLQADQEGVVRAVILRLPAVYGQSGRGGSMGRGVVATMIRRALAGQELTMWHDGSVRRDLLHVDDAAAAFVAALEHEQMLTGRTWALGADRSQPLGEIFTVVAASVARHSGKPAVPVVAVAAPEHAEVNDFRSDDIDSTDFRARTGWRPRVSLVDGVDRTVAAMMLAGGC
uniref:UDP-glucose 4-epimerase n=1 Tax=uncultured bacterium esnapd12 TaxID=1366592 RepID=S5UCH0_9BACT|nr:UDP-glucose 4-epimerase [uncultured bacterium esnapd12]